MAAIEIQQHGPHRIGHGGIQNSMQEQATLFVSDRPRYREPQRALRLLLEELTHRVEREFAAAIRTLSSAAVLAPTEEARNALDAVQCRFENFARVHAALRVPEFRTRIGGCAYLRQLCEAISASRLQFRGIELDCLGSAFDIDTEQCWRLGMIVSQLVCNASAHTFVNSPGRIWVAAARRDSLVWCQVRDNGFADSEALERPGIRIVDALVRDLHGGFEQQHTGEGCAATVIFPAVGV